MQLESPVGAEWTRYRSLNGGWYDANPYGTRYKLRDTYSVHTGSDLNLPGNRDKDQPVYAVDNGFVHFARRVPNSTWGILVVLKHEWGYSRYAHLGTAFVRDGLNLEVKRGQLIGTVGNTGMEYIAGNEHLHFDVSLTQVCEKNPMYWPGDNDLLVRQHFVDPHLLIFAHNRITRVQVISRLRLRIRAAPSLEAPIIGYIKPDAVVDVFWRPVWSRLLSEGYVSTQWLKVIEE